MGVRSHIRVHFLLKIIPGAEGGRSHTTSRSYNRGSYNAGTTVVTNVRENHKIISSVQLSGKCCNGIKNYI